MPHLASFWAVDIIIAVASAVLMLWAFLFYYGRARKVTSSFSVGLTLFAVLFVVQNIVAIFFYFDLATRYSTDVALPMLTINGLGLGAFAALVLVVRR